MYVWVDENIKYGATLGIPPSQSGYEPPKGGGRHWDKEKKGWIDKYGNVWTKDNLHKDHYDVQYPNGGYDNVYPNGKVRAGKGGRGRFSQVEIQVDSSRVQVVENAGKAVGIAIGAVVVYQGIKWVVATITAAPTGGVSLGLAAVMP